MKLGIVIPVYNRPEYLRQCLESLRASEMPEGTRIHFVDDNSTDNDTIHMLNEWGLFNMGIIDYCVNEKNSGVCYSIKRGIDILIKKDCDLFINLDSDAIVRPDWITKILALKEKFPDKIVTGFNCKTKNANGTERHPIIEEGEGYNIKSSVGGLNMCFNREQYEKWILPALEKGMKRLVNWDAEACKNSGGAVCVVPSVVQHIGIQSSMGHREAPDVADDFVMEDELSDMQKDIIEQSRFIANLQPIEEPEHETDTRPHLPNVTLITVNCDKIEGGIKAMDESMKGIKFGAVKFLTSSNTDYRYAVKIPHIANIQDYSKFMIKSLNNYVDTDYVLVIQSDGYVKNPAAWNPDWLKYDYIGATWWYPQFNVGNGGFSLRSKKLLQAVATDEYITKYHPEDDRICRTYGRFLNKKYGIEFAPDAVAKKFSIEGFRQKDKTYSGQFGFHGTAVIFPGGTKLEPNPTVTPLKPVKKPDIILINQPFGLGDFLFCIPLMRDYIKEGFKVVVPVIPAYNNLNKHFPDITFIDRNLVNIDLERKDEYQVHGMKVIPLRWSYEILKVPFRDCMKSKYLMFGKDWKRWRESTWTRDPEKENDLYYNVLGLKDDSRYNLINPTFRNDGSGKAAIRVTNEFQNVELKSIEGFTLLDWGKVIENASTIHTVSTSINYMLELMTLKATEIHLYARKPDEKDFRNIDYLFTRKYRLHY